MSTTHSGSCLCGSVRFDLRGDFAHFFLCHCSHCRKGTGSAHGANLFSDSATLEWKAGADKVTTYQLPGTRHARSFCSTCGSAMPHSTGKMTVVPAGCLDTELSTKPTAHIFVASRGSWEDQLSAAPRFDELPK